MPPITLADCYKTYTHDQDKARTPEETVAAVRARMADIGIDLLESTERVDSGRLGIPVFISRCGADARAVMPTGKQMGKGATPAQAEASAVMELVERFSFFSFLRQGPMIEATYDEVADRAMPFAEIAAAVHHDPADLERAREAFSLVPMTWTEATCLADGRTVLIPLGWFYEINEFNGSSAGNTVEEAVMQGLSEVVERHVSALVARTRPVLPSIDPASAQTPAGKDLAARFADMGIRLHVKDFTLDMGIPTVAALAWDPSTFPQQSEIVYTAGTASNPEMAFIRALTEVAQLAGDFNSCSNFVASGLPKYRDPAEAAYITDEAPIHSLADLPDIRHENIRTEIETAVRGLVERGLPVYAVDITHPRLGIPAVYVMAPGAHFRERAVGSSVPFFAAKLLAAAGGFAAAMGLDRLSELYPEAYYVDFHRGCMLIDREMPDQALPLLRAALDKNPSEEDRAGILTYLGIALKDLEDYDGAVEALTASAAIDPDRQDTFNVLGFCHFRSGRHLEAIAAFRRVLELDPSSAMDYANIGANFRALGRIGEAIRHFEIALDLDPSLDNVRTALDNLLASR